MRAERAIERLGEHQDHVTTIVERARSALVGSRDVEGARLAQMRWELMRVLRDYQLFKHLEIFDPVIGTGAPAEAELATRLKERCNQVAVEYQDHVRRWTLIGAIDRWPDYRLETLAMIDRIVGHLAAERRDVTTLLAGMPRTRRR
jgi:hypothetical protein